MVDHVDLNLFEKQALPRSWTGGSSDCSLKRLLNRLSAPSRAGVFPQLLELEAAEFQFFLLTPSKRHDIVFLIENH